LARGAVMGEHDVNATGVTFRVELVFDSVTKTMLMDEDVAKELDDQVRDANGECSSDDATMRMMIRKATMAMTASLYASKRRR